MNDFSTDYTYRSYCFHTEGRRIPGYDHERYDGTDEADPFREESPQEMAEKCNRNDLLPPGYLRERPVPEELNPVVLESAPAPEGRRYVPPQKRSRGSKVAARYLDLHAVLCDRDVQRKYGFDPATLVQLKGIKNESAARAARVAQEFLREKGYDQTTVRVEKDQSFTKGEAIAELAYYASVSKVKTGLIEAKIVMSTKTDTIHLLPAPYSYDMRNSDAWEIMAPIGHTKYAVDYFKMVSQHGHEEAFIMAGPAAAVLGISFLYTSTVKAMQHPTVESHAAADGARPDDGFDLTGFKLADDEASGKIVKAVRPLIRHGAHFAYTVSVPGSGRLLNGHVRNKALSTKYAGKELRKFQTFRLRAELWCFYDTAFTAGIDVPARTRFPVSGERVRMLIPTMRGEPLVSEWGVINPGLESAWVVTLDDIDVAQPGMSGAPIVSEDGYVVAIHDGITMGRLRVLPVPDVVAGDIPVDVAMNRQLAYGPPDSSHLAFVEFDLRKAAKGYRDRNAVIMSALTCDGDRTILSCAGKRAYVAAHSGNVPIPGCDFHLTATGATGQKNFLPTRAVVPGERVVVVGKTMEGPYVTPVLSLMEIGASPLMAVDLCSDMGKKDFFNGALVVAVDDCRVVGLVSTQGQTTYGVSDHVLMAWKCYDDPTAELAEERKSGGSAASSVMSGSGSGDTTHSSGMFSFVAENLREGVMASPLDEVRQQLHEIFPYLGILDTSKYPDAGLDEVFTHASAGRYLLSERKIFSGNSYWARMGDAAMSYLIMEQMYHLGVGNDKATIIKSRIQNSKVQARVAKEKRLPEFVRYRGGASITSDHVISDLLEAFFGYVYKYSGHGSDISKEMLLDISMGCTTNDIYNL